MQFEFRSVICVPCRFHYAYGYQNCKYAKLSPLTTKQPHYFPPLKCIRFVDQNLSISYKIFSLLFSVYCLVMKSTDQLNEIHNTVPVVEVGLMLASILISASGILSNEIIDFSTFKSMKHYSSSLFFKLMDNCCTKWLKDQSYADIVCVGEWIMGVEYFHCYIFLLPNRLFFLWVHIRPALEPLGIMVPMVPNGT